jgi:putative inorganic carbon (HCO3(-)) transporter
MRPQSLLGTSNTWRVGLILLAVLAAFVAGISGLVYPTPYSSSIVGATVAAAVTAIAFLRKPVWALYAALFVVLLPIGLIPPAMQSILNRTITMVALATWLFDVITWRRQVTWTSSALLMLGFLGWGVLTLLWADNSSLGTSTLQTYALRFILFLLLIPNQIRTKEKLDGLMSTLALNGWVLVVVSAATILIEGYAPGTRLKVLGINENGLGILALVTLQGILWQVVQPSKQRTRLKRLVAFAFLLMAIGLVAASGSRGSAISLFVMLLAFWLWRPTRPWGQLGLLIIAVGAIIAPFIFSTTLERFAIVRGDTLLGGREALWQATWKLILDHPWQGVGIGNVPHAVMPYLTLLRSVWGYESAVIHNPVLTVWAETGLPGILLYLGVLGSAVWLFMRQYLLFHRSGVRVLVPYFALVSSTFLWYMTSWIKGGGMESDFTYFLVLALLVIPFGLDIEEFKRGTGIQSQAISNRAPRAEDTGS